jgi:hypothetical protein
LFKYRSPRFDSSRDGERSECSHGQGDDIV